MADDSTEVETPPVVTPPVTTPPVETPPAEPEFPDWARDPASAQRMVKEARDQAAAERVKARDAAKAEARKELLKELHLTDDTNETPDPAELARTLAAKDTTIRDLTIKNALSDALADAKAKPLARAAVLGEGILSDLDPASSDFQTNVNQRVAEYISKNPELRASQVAAVGGADLSGGAGPARTYTRAQLADQSFYKDNRSDIIAALQQGRITE